MKMVHIYSCHQCPYNCGDGCSTVNGIKEFDFDTFDPDSEDGFPEWCPLEDAKEGDD